MLFFLDFEKAFDFSRMESKVLEIMNFGPMFKEWIHTFYSNLSCSVISNSYASDFFLLQRCIRQGCPLSGFLFALAIEVLA